MMNNSNSNSNGNRVCYCCIWKDGRVVDRYTIGDHEIDNMAALCLETIPPYHRYYFQTMGAYTFAFLIDDGVVFFAILRHSLGNSQLLSFLHKIRDEFRRIGTAPSLDPLCWPGMSNGDVEAGSSTKAPLLARPSKQDKKKMKDDGIGVRDVETAEHRRGADSEGPRMKTNVREKWCRQVRIVLAIDAAVCVLLFVIWLVVCRGIECIR